MQIHTATENARIVYTTNGMIPGSVFTIQSYPSGEGILIETTTVLRVMATTQGHVSTDVDTHTDIFPEHVVHQPEEPLGFSTAWQGADYGMDQDPAHLSLIAGDLNLSPEAAKKVIADALLALPTLSLAIAHGDLLGKAEGIDHNTQDLGRAWERPVCAEWIYPDGRKGFQIDAGIRMQRFTSRDPARNPKHSLKGRSSSGSPYLAIWRLISLIPWCCAQTRKMPGCMMPPTIVLDSLSVMSGTVAFTLRLDNLHHTALGSTCI